MKNTSIQVSTELLEALKKRKLYERESYEEVIRDLIEDATELSADTVREIREARAEYEAGKTYTLEEVKRKHGL